MNSVVQNARRDTLFADGIMDAARASLKTGAVVDAGPQWVRYNSPSL
jgi:hypothetical protein